MLSSICKGQMDPLIKKGTSMAADCLFCKIINKEVPAKIIDENQDVLVIEDIAPKAPVHYLIIPKKHIKDIQAIKEEDADLMAKILFVAQKLAQKLSGSQSFRLVVNNGEDAGQSIFHMHWHFLSGKKMLDL